MVGTVKSDSRSALRGEIITNFGELESLAPEWMRLRNAGRRQDVFASPSWARACRQAYGTLWQVYTPVVYDERGLAAILPLKVEGGVLQFIGAPHSDYNDVLCESTAPATILECCLREMLRQPRPWQECVLENVPEDSVLLDMLSRVSTAMKRRIRVTPGALCPGLDLTGDTGEYLDGLLKKKSLVRHEKSLQRLGPVSFRHLEDREEIKGHLPNLFRFHIARRAVAGDASLFLNADTCAFYRALVDELDPKTDLRFSVLELDRQPVAYHFGFESNGAFMWYKPAFDVKLWEYSPGEVLIKKLLEYARDHKLREFDFTVGNETFKDRFANRVRRNRRIHVYGSPAVALRARLLACAGERARGAQRALGVRSGLKARASGLGRRVVRAIRRDGLARVCRRVLAEAFGRLIFRHDEVLVFAADGATAAPGAAGIGMREVAGMREATLADLADLAVQHPEEFTPEKMQRARDRMRRGDVAYVVRQGGACVHVSWVRIRDVIAAQSELGLCCKIELGRPGAVIYDSWTSPEARGQGLFPNVLAGIVHAEAGKGRESFAYCRSRNTVSRRGILKAGFKLRYKMHRVRLCMWLTRGWVSEVMVH
jgi:CelD/BcsL family acetyltransferase involved in cellulose biosynthesis